MSKLRKSAQGQQCTVRLEQICSFDPDTVVLGHINITKHSGMGLKSPDYMSCYTCSKCHDVIDGRNLKDYLYKDLLRAHLETLYIMVDAGLIEVAK